MYEWGGVRVEVGLWVGLGEGVRLGIGLGVGDISTL